MLEKKGLTVGFVILTALVSWGCNPTFDSGAHIRWKFGVFQVVPTKRLVVLSISLGTGTG